MVEWISVDDSLPEECEDVLVCAEWENAGIGSVSKGKGVKIGWHVSGRWHIDGKCGVHVEYWMDIPKLPNQSYRRRNNTWDFVNY